MRFAERNGFIKEKTIQLTNIDKTLTNRLYNLVFTRFVKDFDYLSEELEYVVDKLGYKIEVRLQDNWNTVRILLQKVSPDIPWYMPYEIIEIFFEARNVCSSRHDEDPYIYKLWLKNVYAEINDILEQEKSGYRFINNRFVNITSSQELKEISTATHSDYDSVNIHLQKAFLLYADRKCPDYENSIKESISAVEAMCCIITGVRGSQSTLGNTLKKLETKGVVIHTAMKEGFKKLYGYTSDADGIRHGGIDFTKASEEDARYMMVSCSAFINYLIQKNNKK